MHRFVSHLAERQVNPVPHLTGRGGAHDYLKVRQMRIGDAERRALHRFYPYPPERRIGYSIRDIYDVLRRIGLRRHGIKDRHALGPVKRTRPDVCNRRWQNDVLRKHSLKRAGTDVAQRVRQLDALAPQLARSEGDRLMLIDAAGAKPLGNIRAPVSHGKAARAERPLGDGDHAIGNIDLKPAATGSDIAGTVDYPLWRERPRSAEIRRGAPHLRHRLPRRHLPPRHNPLQETPR